jgi:hypothetical protein
LMKALSSATSMTELYTCAAIGASLGENLWANLVCRSGEPVQTWAISWLASPRYTHILAPDANWSGYARCTVFPSVQFVPSMTTLMPYSPSMPVMVLA